MKETTDTVKSASHVDLNLETDNDNEGRLMQNLRQKRRFQLPNCELSIFM